MKNRYMKYIILTLVLMTCAFLINKGTVTYAEQSSISSYGELHFNNEEAVIYYEDILFLQSELNDLFNEISN